MNDVDDLIDKLLSPKFVLVLFSVTACVGFLTGKLDLAVFGGALGTVLGYFYGSKQGEAAATLLNAATNAASTTTTQVTSKPDSTTVSTTNVPPPVIPPIIKE